MNKQIKKAAVLFTALFLLTAGLYADPTHSPFGADAVPDLYSAADTADGFSTSQGGASFSGLNPAQGGDANRMIFDASYLAIPKLLPGDEPFDKGYMQSFSAGALFPTKSGVFGASLRLIGGAEKDMFAYFPIAPTFGGNLFAAKELYPGMSLGIGLNFGFGKFTKPEVVDGKVQDVEKSANTFSGDIGFRYNTGNLGPFQNFTIGVVLRSLGVSYAPTSFTPVGGISLDLIHVNGKENKKDPFVLNFATDLLFPLGSLFYKDDGFEGPHANLIVKTGLKIMILETVFLNVSWPGGSGLNVYELTREKPYRVAFPVIPAIGLGVKFMLPTTGERIAGGRLPGDGDLLISTGFKPLYEGVAAVGGGVSWYAGVADKKPPVIELKYPDTAYFSPNNDGKADTLEIPLTITDQSYIASWSVEIKDEKGNVVRVIENKEQRFESFNMKEFFNRLTTTKKQIDIPPAIVWDGIKNTGDVAPDGTYTFTVSSSDVLGNKGVTSEYKTVVKNKVPEIAINPIPDAQRIFDPKGAAAPGQTSGNRSVTFTPRGSVEDSWESGIYNAAGQKVKTFEPQNGAPRPVTWDGRNDSGQIASDGVYSFRIGTTDKAQNTASAELTNVILDSREAGAFLTASVPAIAPAKNQATNIVNFNIRLSLTDGIDNWKLELKDDTGKAQRTFTGRSPAPTVQGWNGLDESGNINEGLFTAELTVNYTRGDVVKASASPVLVDVSGPVLTVATTPEYFSPDNDGENDELFIALTTKDASPIATWTFEIRTPVESGNSQTFRKIEGRGSPASRIIWDGKSDKGELVQSAMYYPFKFTAVDALGNSSTMDGRIGIDVLVIREGDRLKIQIPSIQFRPNFADFEGLPKDVVDNNMRIIRRIAQILNQFRDYKVQVEGHANPTQPVGAARDREEGELKRISEARAKAIVDQLARNGVARSRLSATGAGSSKTIAAFEDRDNWWKNRRVEFYLIK
jgi:outer membrane protein OmpA-like peptidoglycan-associated protein/flagellar hook assembly protein FlgD